MYKTYVELSDSHGLPFILNADFSLDAGRLTALLQKEQPDILLFCNPNNPTGNLYQRAELLSVIKQAPCLVLLDEAYMEFAPPGQSLLPDLIDCSNLAIFRTFSKAYGLAGLRVGYILSGNRRIIDGISKALLPYNVNALSLAVAQTVYKHRHSYDPLIRAIIAERERIGARLDALGLQSYPSATNFIFFRYLNQEKTAALAAALAARQIFVRDFTKNPDLSGLRLTIGQPRENDIALSAISDCIK
jgi:histidinol-phosphate aminotransferase